MVDKKTEVRIMWLGTKDFKFLKKFLNADSEFSRVASDRNTTCTVVLERPGIRRVLTVIDKEN